MYWRGFATLPSLAKHSSPIPAFAGMTMVGRRPTVRGGWLHGVAPHCPPPLWIPAFAGLTKVGGRRSWEGGLASDAPWRRFATLPTAPLDSGLRRNDEVGGRHDEAGGGVQARRLGHQYPRQTTSWYKSLQVGLFASISLIFQALFHSLSAFSLLIALSIVS